MKIKCLMDRKASIMRPRENHVGSMQVAFQNVMNEIIEHVIEGICFEVHRAVKLDYFPVDEYILEKNKFVIHKGEETSYTVDDDNQDIFGKKNTSNKFSPCPFCGQLKQATVLGRHILTCGRTNGSTTQDNGKSENNVKDEDNSDGKKENDAEKQAKSTVNYDTASPEQIREFLLKHCGVISKVSKKPCRNSSNCCVHSKEDQEKIRCYMFERYVENLDGDIDIDTVD